MYYLATDQINNTVKELLLITTITRLLRILFVLINNVKRMMMIIYVLCRRGMKMEIVQLFLFSEEETKKCTYLY